MNFSFTLISLSSAYHSPPYKSTTRFRLERETAQNCGKTKYGKKKYIFRFNEFFSSF